MWKMIHTDRVVSEPARESTPLDLLFASREGLVGDVMAGSHLGHSNHEMIEVLILREVRRESAELLPWIFGGQTLACLGAWLMESLGRQS